MNNDENKKEQVTELKALRHEYRLKAKTAANTFEFLGPKVPEATEANPTRMKICNPSNGIAVTITMPSRYPSDAPPQFMVEKGEGTTGILAGEEATAMTAAHHVAIEELLVEQAVYARHAVYRHVSPRARRFGYVDVRCRSTRTMSVDF